MEKLYFFSPVIILQMGQNVKQVIRQNPAEKIFFHQLLSKKRRRL